MTQQLLEATRETREVRPGDGGPGDDAGYAPGWARVWRPVADRPLSAWLCLGLLVTTMFAGQAEIFRLPVPPHRILLVLTLLALVNERVGRFRRPQVRGVHVFMLATLLWATGSAIAAGTVQTDYGRFALLDRLAIPFLAFAVAPAVFRTDRERDLLLKCLVLMGIYLGATAYFEIIGPHSLVYPRFIMDPSLGIHYGRARGPFLSAEPDGLVMLTCAFAGWYGVWRLLSLAVIPLAGFGCVLTLTRSIWVGLAIAFVVAGLRDQRLRTWSPVAAVLIVGALLAALAYFPAVKELATGRAGTDGSLYDRASTNAAAVRIIEQHPVFGIGWVRFIDVNQDYVRQSDIPLGHTDIEAHNVFLARASELGLPGAVLWLGAVVLGPFRAVFRRRREGERLGLVSRLLGPVDPTGWPAIAAATTCAWATTLMFSPVPYPLPNLLVFLLAGMVLADRTRDATPPPA